ncbi:MAG: AAA domain-containing protein [Phycisphaerae bacterium]|nr:AAA domain-containing protein [Phycisphaerae bacterium]
MRIEERANVSAFSSQEGSEFLTLDGPVDWRSIGAGQPLRISGREEWEPFFRRNRSKGPFHTFYLGTPVDVFIGTNRHKTEYRLISPALVVSVIATMRDGWVDLQPTNLVEINHLWAERRIPDARKRREFLDEVGLSPTQLGDADQDELWAVGGFKEAAKALFLARKGWWKEYPDLDKLSKAPAYDAIHESGLYNRAVLICQPALKFTKRLYEELQQLAYVVSDNDLDKTALATLFPHRPPDSGKSPSAIPTESPIAEFCQLNSHQRTACQHAMTSPLVTVTGPPGTGKSVVVSHILVNAAIQGRSALFASRNHQAIEAVEPRINAMVEPETLVLRPTRPFGAQAAQFEWYQAMTTLLARPRRHTLDNERDEAQARVTDLLGRRHCAETQAAALLDLNVQLSSAEAECQEFGRRCPDSWAELAAGSSSLLPQSTFERLQRLAQLISASRTPWYFRLFGWLWRRVRLRRLRAELRAVLESLSPAIRTQLAADVTTGSVGPGNLAAVCERLLRFSEYANAIFRRTAIESSLTALPSRDKIQTALRESQRELEAATRALMRLTAESSGAQISDEQREEFAQLRAAMRNRPQDLTDGGIDSEVAKAFRRAMPELMRHFPLWSVSNLSVSKAIPLAPASFELVVVDEASQCDIASVIPLLYRAARATIVGDPNQLAHVTKLERDTDMRLREQAAVADFAFERYTFAANSMYDLASSSRARVAVELRNHYRCHPEIAEFCNNSFYKGTLCVMTDADTLTSRLGLTRQQRACVWEHVPGDAVGASTGCFSPGQILRIIEDLKRLASDDFPGTIGVVTPFRAQAQRVSDLVHQQLGAPQLSRWRFLVDTVDGFQGDERDLILFSLVGGIDMPSGSAYFLKSTPNRFNVAVSRARALLRVYGDKDWASSCGIPFISELLRRCQCDQLIAAQVRRHDLVGPVWEPLFANALQATELSFEQQYPACGYFLDFALFGPHGKLNVEIDGETFHRSATGGHTVDDIYRDLVLESAGWRIVRFWVYQLRENIDECIDRVRREYEQHCCSDANGLGVSASITAQRVQS